jgi:HAD superfamily hydrolase (TIGR01509 family)
MDTGISWTDVKVVIFDCDGVMFDSRKANEAYYNDILYHFGKEQMNDEQCQYVHMNTAIQSVAHLFKDDDQAQEAEAFRKQMSYFPYITKMQMEPYLKRFLAYLKPRFKTAIATNRSDTMGRVLEEHGLAGYFDLVVSSLDVKHPKPAPDALFKILEHFGVSAQETVYIGDSKIDEQTAKAAKVPFIAYKNRGLAAARHIEHFKEIEVFLEVGKGPTKTVSSGGTL